MTSLRWHVAASLVLAVASPRTATPPTSAAATSFAVEPEGDVVADTSQEGGDYGGLGGGRFPPHGTDAFSALCGWASPGGISGSDDDGSSSSGADNPPPRGECSLLVRPRPSSSEGLGLWVSEVVSGFLLAVQSGCRLLIDYGPGVEVGRVFRTVDPVTWNWTVPEDPPENYRCDRTTRCQIVSIGWSDKIMGLVGKALGVRTSSSPSPSSPSLVPVPSYRFAYSSDEFDNLRSALPQSFDPRSGMACAFGSLLDLAPTAKEYMPRLFGEILPAVRDPDAVVVALYMRTGRTDKIADAERRAKAEAAAASEGNDGTSGSDLVEEEEDKTPLSRLDKGVTECALLVEERLIRLYSGRDDRRHPARVVWTVVTDSPNVGRIVADIYGGKIVDAVPPSSSSSSEGIPTAAEIHRTVVTTSARGTHIRPQRGPSTSDFAEAFLDWYLLGESDAVVESGTYSFGRTGALRTARTLYVANHKGGCDLKEWGL